MGAVLAALGCCGDVDGDESVGEQAANKTATISTVFSWLVILGNFVVWIVAVVIYRDEKDKGGVSNDLWGWTCSEGAKAIQHAFDEVNFNSYCNIQVSGDTWGSLVAHGWPMVSCLHDHRAPPGTLACSK